LIRNALRRLDDVLDCAGFEIRGRRLKEELKAADAAMVAMANPSGGGFDVRCFRLRTDYGATGDV